MGYSSKNTIDGKSMRKMRAVMSHSSLAPTSDQRSSRHKNHALIDSFISKHAGTKGDRQALLSRNASISEFGYFI